MSNDPLQPQESADIEGQNAPLDDVIAAGEETADLIEETPVTEKLEGETLEAVDEASEALPDQLESSAETLEGVVEETPAVLEAAVHEEEPRKKRSFFDRLFGRKEETIEAVAEIPEVESEKPSVEGAVLDEKSPETTDEDQTTAPLAVEPVAPAINLDDVRSMVKEEIEQVQGGITAAIQTELARLENDTARRDYEIAQNTMENFYRNKSEMTIAKVEALKQRQAVVFTDTSRPVKEVKEDVGMISEMLGEAEADLAELQTIVTNRAAVTSELVASLGAREQIAALQSQLEEQKSQVAALDEKVKSRTGGAVVGKAGLNWWQLLGLAAILLLAVGLSTLYLRSSVLNQKPAALLVETAGLYQSTGDTDEAVRVLDEAMAAGIKDAQVLGRAGEMYRLLKQYDKAIDALNKALAKEPDNETYLLSLARAYGNNGKHAEAIPLYQKLIGLDPNNTTYLNELAARYRSNRNYNEAFATLDKVLALKPANWSVYNTKGDVFRDQQMWDQAIEQYKKALEINDNYISHLNMGVSYAAKRDYTAALEQYGLATGISPERADPYYYSAEARVAQGKSDEAIGLYQQALSVNEKYALAYIGLARVYAAKGDCASALPYYQQSLNYSATKDEAVQGVNTCLNTTK